MKNFKSVFFTLFFLVLLFPISVFAFTAEKGNAVYVGETKTIEGNYFAAGTNVTIDGHVTGDVFCAAQSIVINGTVDGDVICAGQSVSINGKIGGNLRSAASDINIRGTIDRNISVAGANVNVEKSGRIGWDALIAAANVQMRGELGRSLHGAGANYILGGKIAGNVDLYLDSNQKNQNNELNIDETAEIGGQLNYTSISDAKISEQAKITGEVVHKEFPITKDKKSKDSGKAGFLLIGLISALIVGMILTKYWRSPILEITSSMAKKFWPTIGWGLLVIIVTPIIALLLAISIVGARLALIIFSAWMFIMMFSKILSAIAIGIILVKKYWQSKKDSLTSAMVTGIIISWLVFYIPVIGTLVSFVAVWWGMGGSVMYLKKMYNK